MEQSKKSDPNDETASAQKNAAPWNPNISPLYINMIGRMSNCINLDLDIWFCGDVNDDIISGPMYLTNIKILVINDK